MSSSVSSASPSLSGSDRRIGPSRRGGLGVAVAAVPAPEQAVGRVVEQGLRAREFVLAGLAVFEQRAGRGGDVGRVGPAQRSARNTGKFSAADWLEPVAQVGVVHLVLDDAEGDPRVAADDDDLADRVAGDPRAPGRGGSAGWGFIKARARMPETTVEGHRGDWTLRNSSSAEIRAGADHLDPVPGHPVRRLAAQALDPEPLVQAGGAVDRPGAGSAPETGRPARPRPRSPAS